jgi:hypothetical protein
VKRQSRSIVTALRVLPGTLHHSPHMPAAWSMIDRMAPPCTMPLRFMWSGPASIAMRAKPSRHSSTSMPSRRW